MQRRTKSISHPMDYPYSLDVIPLQIMKSEEYWIKSKKSHRMRWLSSHLTMEICSERTDYFSKNAAAYREVANIPLIIKGGAKGCVEDAMASHIDIAPTIMDYFGLPIPKLLEGKSMLPQIYEPSKEINDVVYTEFTRYELDHDGFGGLQIMRAVMSKRYKLVIHLLDSDEFYDLEKDPYEMNNLIDDETYTEIRNEMHDRLIEHMNSTRDLYRGYQWRMRPWRKDFIPNWENEGYTRAERE